MMSCMKTASPGAGIWFGKVALSACAFGSSRGWLLLRVTDLGTVVCWNGFLFFFFYLMESRNTPCLSTAVQGSLSRRECWLSLFTHSFYLYFLKKRRAKRGPWTAPGPFLPCMQCLGPAEGHRDLMTYSRWPASDCYAWSGPPEGAEGLPQDLE